MPWWYFITYDEGSLLYSITSVISYGTPQKLKYLQCPRGLYKILPPFSQPKLLLFPLLPPYTLPLLQAIATHPTPPSTVPPTSRRHKPTSEPWQELFHLPGSCFPWLSKELNLLLSPSLYLNVTWSERPSFILLHQNDLLFTAPLSSSPALVPLLTLTLSLLPPEALIQLWVVCLLNLHVSSVRAAILLCSPLGPQHLE